MPTDLDELIELVQRPRESLSVEVKRWIDPTQPEGIAKIVKAALAHRNHNGGYLVIGFDDATLLPDPNPPPNARAAFHVDQIQAMVTKFSSEPFEVKVEFITRGGQDYPVIVIPSGVISPVAAKADLRSGNALLIEAGALYVRTLNANHTPSSSKATWKDWPDITRVCFDNREADIGQFLRRHLSGLDLAGILQAVADATQPAPQARSTQDRLAERLAYWRQRFDAAVSAAGTAVAGLGTWEVALAINGTILPCVANATFLQVLGTANPHLSGWPVWLDSSTFQDGNLRPYVYDNAWEEYLATSGFSWDHVDFIRFEPAGLFYQVRVLEDDLVHEDLQIQPRSVLDLSLPIVRVAEAIAVGLSFARALEASDDSTLTFFFRWRGLAGRNLVAWVDRERALMRTRQSRQDEVVSVVTLSAETPASAINEHVANAVRPLFAVFEGFDPDRHVIAQLVSQLLERRR